MDSESRGKQRKSLINVTVSEIKQMKYKHIKIKK